MRRVLRVASATLLMSGLFLSTSEAVVCNRFSGSTAETTGGMVNLPWRTDYPASAGAIAKPWTAFKVDTRWRDYMDAVLSTIRPHVSIAGKKLTMSAGAPWWVSSWLDVGNNGREPILGLTRERKPDPKDLSPTSADNHQVWAVGFYNQPGAFELGKVFADPCDADVDPPPIFPTGTVSIKFLFTDAPDSDASYLAGAPTVTAKINKAGTGTSGTVADRVDRDVRLLQVDIAVKDEDAAQKTGWVFATYTWMGPPKGDGFYDNLVPVGLQWGNDSGKYGTTLTESIINPAIKDKLYGWTPRLFMGFNGRMNGPADNMRSSCLSCHAAAQSPRAKYSSNGLVGSIGIPGDLASPTKVKDHIDTWFVDVPPGSLFDKSVKNGVALDYSLQLEAALFRICQACREGTLSGSTPATCKRTELWTQDTCKTPPTAGAVIFAEPALREQAEIPARQ